MAVSGKRWMLFVDGENFTIQAEKYANDNNLAIDNYERYHKGVYFWMDQPFFEYFKTIHDHPWLLADHPIRQYYYTTATGSDEYIEKIKLNIRRMFFEPVVFKKEQKSKKTKGVDITLTTHMLCHAFRDNYDVAVLVAGDGDYVPLVEEVKRLGKIVWLFFWSLEYGLNVKLDIACDVHFNMNKWLKQALPKLK